MEEEIDDFKLRLGELKSMTSSTPEVWRMTVSIPKIERVFIVSWSRMTEEFSRFVANGKLDESIDHLTDIMSGSL